jgi:hypothetical protein
LASRTAPTGNYSAGVLTVASLNNLPGGWIGYAQITADSSNYTTLVDISGLSQAVTVNTTRRIKISVSLQVAGESGALGDVYIREGTTELKKTRYQFATGSGTCIVSLWHVLTPSSGSHTYKVSAERITGTVAHNILASSDASGGGFGPAGLLIEDVGPAS